MPQIDINYNDSLLFQKDFENPKVISRLALHIKNIAFEKLIASVPDPLYPDIDIDASERQIIRYLAYEKMTVDIPFLITNSADAQILLEYAENNTLLHKCLEGLAQAYYFPAQWNEMLAKLGKEISRTLNNYDAYTNYKKKILSDNNTGIDYRVKWIQEAPQNTLRLELWLDPTSCNRMNEWQVNALSAKLFSKIYIDQTEKKLLKECGEAERIKVPYRKIIPFDQKKLALKFLKTIPEHESSLRKCVLTLSKTTPPLPYMILKPLQNRLSKKLPHWNVDCHLTRNFEPEIYLTPPITKKERLTQLSKIVITEIEQELLLLYANRFDTIPYRTLSFDLVKNISIINSFTEWDNIYHLNPNLLDYVNDLIQYMGKELEQCVSEKYPEWVCYYSVESNILKIGFHLTFSASIKKISFTFKYYMGL